MHIEVEICIIPPEYATGNPSRGFVPPESAAPSAGDAAILPRPPLERRSSAIRDMMR